MQRPNSYGKRLIRMIKFSLSQIGYRCKSDQITFSRNKKSWALLGLGILVFLLSLFSANDGEVISLLINLFVTAMLFIATYASHSEAVDKWREKNVKVGDSGTGENRTAYGSQLVIYVMVAAYSVLAFIYRLFYGEIAVWLINFAVYFMECADIVISTMVILFDAELIMD